MIAQGLRETRTTVAGWLFIKNLFDRPSTMNESVQGARSLILLYINETKRPVSSILDDFTPLDRPRLIEFSVKSSSLASTYMSVEFTTKYKLAGKIGDIQSAECGTYLAFSERTISNFSLYLHVFYWEQKAK